MATQRIIISKIGGEAGMTILHQFQEWNSLRSAERTPGVLDADQWPIAAHRQMDALVDALRTQSDTPPIVFFSEYVDMWSMGDLLDRWADKANEHFIKTASPRLELACYLLPDNDRLVSVLRRSLRRKAIRDREPQEARWFVLTLLEAVLAYQPSVSDAVLVFIREVLGSLICDSELERSLIGIPEWLRNLDGMDVGVESKNINET